MSAIKSWVGKQGPVPNFLGSKRIGALPASFGWSATARKGTLTLEHDDYNEDTRIRYAAHFAVFRLQRRWLQCVLLVFVDTLYDCTN